MFEKRTSCHPRCCYDNCTNLFAHLVRLSNLQCVVMQTQYDSRCLAGLLICTAHNGCVQKTSFAKCGRIHRFWRHCGSWDDADTDAWAHCLKWLLSIFLSFQLLFWANYSLTCKVILPPMQCAQGKGKHCMSDFQSISSNSTLNLLMIKSKVRERWSWIWDFGTHK